MKFKCEMISCSNTESKGNVYLWKVNDLLFIGKVFIFGNLRSSAIENMRLKNDCITIDTKDTTYVFKEVN